MPRSYSEEEIQEIVTAVESADNAFRAGNFAIAEEIYSQAFPLLEQAVGKDDPDTLSCLQNLADCCFGVEAYADAIRHYEKLVNTHERLVGASHQTTIALLLKLAKAYDAAGRTEDVQRALQAASERTHVPVNDLLDTADRVINDARSNESDRNQQRKQLEELQRSTQAFQQLKMPASFDDDNEVTHLDSEVDQNISHRMHRPSALRSQTSELRRVSDVEEEKPVPEDFVGLLKAKAPIIVPIVGVILVIGLIVFIWLSLPSSAPPAPNPTVATTSQAPAENAAPEETYFQTPDSQEVLKIEGDQADLVIGKDTAKCPISHIGKNWTDIFQILIGPFTGHEIWFIETADGLTRENGPKYYGKNSPESVVINKINAVGRKAASWYMVSRTYPLTSEELFGNEVMYTNPVTNMPAGPLLARFDGTESDIKQLIDGSPEQSLEEAFRHIRNKNGVGVKNDSTGLWKDEAKAKPCAIHALTVLAGADSSHHLFFVHGFDRHGELLKAAVNYPDEVFLVSLRDGQQSKFDQPTFLEKPPVRERRIVIVKPPENTDPRLVHFIWPLIFAVFAVVSVACTGFESAADGGRNVGVLPKGTAVVATWVFVVLCFASMIALIAP